MKCRAEIEAQDLIELDTEDSRYLKVIGCTATLSLVREFRDQYGKDLKEWPLPTKTDHSSLLLKEALEKQRGQWQFPYPHDEICHCRSVATHKVDQVILAGAHTTEQVSRLTSASTACGTCRPEVEKILRWRGLLK